MFKGFIVCAVVLMAKTALTTNENLDTIIVDLRVYGLRCGIDSEDSADYERTRILTLSIAEFSNFTEAIEPFVLG